MSGDIYSEAVVVLQIHWYLKSYWGGWPPSRANLDWTDIASRADLLPKNCSTRGESLVG